MNPASDSRTVTRYVFWPIVRNALLFGVAYSGLHWLGVRAFGADAAHEAARELAIPTIFGLLLFLPLIWIHLRRVDPAPAAELTSLKAKSLRPLESVFALALFIVPTIIVQPLVGELAMTSVTVHSVDEIAEKDQADAFRAQQIQIDASTFTFALNSHKRYDKPSRTYQREYTIWAAVQASPTGPRERSVWIGTTFRYSGGQQYSTVTIEQLRHQAREELLSISSLTILERVTNRSDRAGFLRAIRALTEVPDAGAMIIVSPRIAPDGWLYVQPWGLYTFVILALLLLTVLRLARRTNAAEGPDAYGIRNAIMTTFIAPYPADPLLIRFGVALSIIAVGAHVVLLMAGVHALHPGPQSLSPWGAVQSVDDLEGGWWRLLTYSFVPYNTISLGMSLCQLWIAILVLYPLRCTGEVIAAYCIAVITSAATGILDYDLSGNAAAPYVLAGSVAPIASLYGFALVPLIRDRVPKTLESITSTLIVTGIATTSLISENLDGSDLTTSAAGFLTGAITGALFTGRGHVGR